MSVANSYENLFLLADIYLRIMLCKEKLSHEASCLLDTWWEQKIEIFASFTI